MDLSFIIITNGKKPLELSYQIKSIQDQNIQNYEIIIVGNINNIDHTDNKNIHLINDEYNANRGSLGGLRNKACSMAKYENLVISDDDMLFTTNWYDQLSKNLNFEILTTCIRNPDGTRFWDNACYQSPIRGHINLNYNEVDDYLYMSGGQSWLIKKNLWEKVKWDEELLIYKMNNLDAYSKGFHNEDTDFAFRCRENKIRIKHDPNTVVFHNDQSYTGIGRMVRRRSIKKNQLWCKDFDFPEKFSVDFSINLINNGLHAEGADLLRFFAFNKNSSFSKNVFLQLESQLGGNLENSEFYIEHHPDYNNLIKSFENG